MEKVCKNCLYHIYSEIFEECICIADSAEFEHAHDAYCENEKYGLNECRHFCKDVDKVN